MADAFVSNCVPWPFGLAEHVVGIGFKDLHTDTQRSARLTGGSGIEDRVRVKFIDGGKGTG
jgi:hypothetical protein